MKRLLQAFSVLLVIAGLAAPFAKGQAVKPPVLTLAGPQSYTAGTDIGLLKPTNTGGAVPGLMYAQTTTVATNLNTFYGMVSDAANNLYVADVDYHLIRKISPSGVVTRFAGSGVAGFINGTGSGASFNRPVGLAIDANGNLYVTEAGNHAIRKISPYGVVTTLAGNGTAGLTNATGTSAKFNSPGGIAIDGNGTLYVSDNGNHTIRKVTATGAVTTLAGNGSGGFINATGTAASFYNPIGITVDSTGNVYVADAGNSVIRKITPAGAVTTFAGTPGNIGSADGTGGAASFNQLQGLEADALGNLYVADSQNGTIRKITPAGVVTTLAGSTAGSIDGIGTGAGFATPTGLALDDSGVLYVAEYGRVRKVSLVGYAISPALPAGLSFDALSASITSIPVLAKAATAYQLTGYNTGGSSTASVSITVTGTIKVTPPAIKAPIISYPGAQSYTAGTAITNLSPSNTGGAVPAQFYGQVSTFSQLTGLSTSDNGTIGTGIVMDAQGNIYYAETGTHLIKKITPSGTKTIFAGSGAAGSANGQGTAASFNRPTGLAIDAAGNIYVADGNNDAIRKITPSGLVSTLTISSVVGNGYQSGPSKALNRPQWLAVDANGNIYVTDNNSPTVKKISTNGVISVLATLDRPQGIAVDALFNVYVADASGYVKKIAPDGVTTTLAGGGAGGSTDGQGTAASFSSPANITLDVLGNLYVTEFNATTLRVVSPTGLVTTIAGGGTGDGIGTAAGFGLPVNLTGDGAGNLYVVDYYGAAIRKISISGYSLKGALPAGLVFDGTTGVISGTPVLAKAAASYSITAYNTGGSSTATVSIAVTGTIKAPVSPVNAPVIAYASPQSYTAGNAVSNLAPTNTGGAVPALAYAQVSTFATVSGLSTADNGTISTGIVTDSQGNIYYSETGNHLIRKITPAGVKSIFAGSGSAGFANGQGTAASFNKPLGLAIDASGNIYVADGNNNLIRKISPLGVVSTYAGNGTMGGSNGASLAGSFTRPQFIAIDALGSLYVTESNSTFIRKISPNGIITTLAATGNPQGLAVDAFFNVYVADGANNVIKKISPDGVISVFAGSGTGGFADGQGTAATFYTPSSIYIDGLGNLYVTDLSYMLLRTISPTGLVSTLAGGGRGDGIGTAAGFTSPANLTGDGAGNLYIVDHYNNAIRKVAIAGYGLKGVLPAGLNFDGATGVISGVPLLAKAAANYTITAYNAGGSSTATVNITVTGTPAAPAAIAAPVITYAGPQTYTAGTSITALSPANTGGAIPAALYGQTATYAGTGVAGADNGNAATASFNTPMGTAADVYGNIYVADQYNHAIRKITAAGAVSIFAGSGSPAFLDATGTAASFYYPAGVAVDLLGNVYVADAYNDLIRKITPAGVVTTVAGKVRVEGFGNATGTNAVFNYPVDIAVDASRNLYVADRGNYLVRKITAAGVVSTLAGSPGSSGYANGTGGAAAFGVLGGIAVDGSGIVYVSDQTNNVIRKITAAGAVTLFAGTPGNAGNADGTGSAALFNTPTGLSVDKDGNVYVADQGNNIIRKITKTGVVSTLAGNGDQNLLNGVGAASSFRAPYGLVVDYTGNVFVSDKNNNVIRKITATGYTTDNALPAGLTLDGATGIISGKPTNPQAATVYSITGYNGGGSSTATVSITVSGTAVANAVLAAPKIAYATPKSYAVGTAITPLSPTSTGGAIPAAAYTQTSVFANIGGNSRGIVFDKAGNSYVAYQSRILKISPAGVVSTFAGSQLSGAVNGKGTAARFGSPGGLAIDAAGNIYVADPQNNLIRKVSPSGVVTTVAGIAGVSGSANGAAATATFGGPQQLTLDAAGNIYVTDAFHQIRKITPGGTVSTFAGSPNGEGGYADDTGTAARFNSPNGIVADKARNLYVSDNVNHVIRKITPAGVVSTLAGTAGVTGSDNGIGAAATFYYPTGLAIDALGNLYVADQYNHLIRKITPAGAVSTVAGNGAPGNDSGTGNTTTLSHPYALAIDSASDLYVADGNAAIRRISLNGYSLTGTLPAGLTFDATTGTISGTPVLATAAANYTVTAYNAGGSSSTVVNIAVTGTITAPVNPVKAPVIAYATPKTYPAGTAIANLSPTNTGGAVPATVYAQTTTFASGANYSRGVATDAAGNVYYTNTNQVFKISPAGATTLFAGSGNAGAVNDAGTAASFNGLKGIAVDASGNVYVVDGGNNQIRKITPAGVVTTLAGNANRAPGRADGPGATASFNGPEGIAVDTYGNVYVADAANNIIRKISPTRIVSTLAGSTGAGATDATGVAASFNGPTGIAVDVLGNLYVTDTNNQTIRKITPAGVVSTYAGTAGTGGAANNTGAAASFYNPGGITMDAAGNLYVADQYNHLIRKITPARVVSTLAGNSTQGTTNGTGASASFNYPFAIAFAPSGDLYITDDNNIIRKVSLNGYSLTGKLPVGLAFDPTTGAISGTPVAAATAANYSVTAYNAGGSSTATVNIAVTGTVIPPVNPVKAPVIAYATPQSYTAGVSVAPLAPTNTGGAVPAVLYGQTTNFGPALSYSGISGLAGNQAGDVFFSANNQIVKVSAAGVVTLFAGTGTPGSIDGDASSASFYSPQGLAFDAAGNLYVACATGNTIRKITPAGVVSTFAGTGVAGSSDGPGASASFNFPTHIAIDIYGNLYVSDSNNHLIRKISPAGVVSTLAGSGTSGFVNNTGAAASFSSPQGIAVDAAGNVYVADFGNNSIRKITAAGVVTTLAGNNNADFVNATGTAAAFSYPYGLSIDKAGNLYVADYYNNAIRKVTSAGVVTTLAGRKDVSDFQNGIGTAASFRNPQAIAVDSLGNVYVAEASGQLRKVSAFGYSIAGTLPAGLTFEGTTGTITGTPLVASAAKSYSVTAYNAGGSSTASVSIAVTGTAVAPAAPTVPVISYPATQTFVVGAPIAAVTPTNTGGTIPAAIYANTTAFAGTGENGPADGKANTATFYGINGIATDPYGNVYTADGTNNIIRKITQNGFVSTLAGTLTPGMLNNTGTAALFNNPAGIAVDKSSNVYVSDLNNQVIRKITPLGVVTTFSGNGIYGGVNGSSGAAGYANPGALAIDKSGVLYLADNDGTRVRKISTSGTASSLAGNDSPGFANATGTAASFSGIKGLVVDASGNVYVADAGNNRIRKITSAGVVTTLAGSGTAGFADGTGTAASFSNPTGITIDAAGNLYVTDQGNNLLRKITPAGVVTTIAGNGNPVSADGVGLAAGFASATHLSIDNDGNLYVVEKGNTIREISINGYTTNAPLPAGLAFDSKTGIISGTPTAASPANTYAIAGNNSAGTSTANTTITVIYPPVVTPTTTVTAFASKGDVTPVPVTVDNGIKVTDLSKTTLASITVSITGNFMAAQDVLALTTNAATMGNITAAYNANTGVLALTSASATATLAQWQAALQAVTYNNTNNVSPNVASRTISFVANDGTFNSEITTKTIALTYTAASNVALSNLTISAGTLSPVFASGTTAYTANVGNSVASVTVVPTTTGANTTIKVNGAVVNSGVASAAIPLTVGANTITTVITSQSLSTTYTITINRNAAQAITFNTLAASSYGAADYAPVATSTNTTIPITYTSSNTAVATITASGNIHIVSPGNTVITASQAAGAGYDAATPVTQSLVVNPATITVTVANQSKNYGAANPALTATYAGFVNGETQTVLTQLPAISTTATTASASGTYPITASGATAANYTFTYKAGVLTVNKVSLTITANDQAKTYGAANPALTLAYAGFVNDDTQASLTTQPTASTTATATTAVGTYPISVSGAVAANYTLSYVAGKLVIGKANLLITANDQTKVYSTANPTLTASYTGFVNNDNAATLATQVALATTATTTSAVGTYPITLSGATSGNYNITYKQGTLTITPVQLAFNPIATQVYGNADVAPGATSTASISYTSGNTAVATIVGGNLHIVGPGTSTITANNGSSTVSQTLTVQPAVLTVTANNQSKITGEANPALIVTYSGFVNGDTQAVLTTPATASTTATTTSGVGTYPITASGAAATNYTFNYVAGTLTINAVPMAFAAIPAKLYGTADFSPGATSSSAITYTCSDATVATIVSGNIHIVGVGTAVITATSGSSSLTQTLTVNPAALVIKAVAKSKVYGAANPTLTVTYTGFVNAETTTVLTTQPTITTTATSTSAAGSYTITVSGAAAKNYTIGYATASLSINKAPLTITANNQTKTAGAANPALTLSYTGFVNSETQTVFTTQPTVSTTATTASAAGNYPITVSGAVAANYTITYVAGTLTVNAVPLTFAAIPGKTYGAADFNAGAASGSAITYTSSNTAVATIVAGNVHIVGVGTSTITATSGTSTLTQSLSVSPAALTISAANQTKIYSKANPVFTATYKGFVNGDTTSVLTALPVLATSATTTSAAGYYAITASGAAAANYTINYGIGTLTVMKAQLNIVANSLVKASGAANPTLTLSYEGFLNNETPAVLSAQPVLSTTATTASAAGTYPITVSGAAAANYDIAYIAGTLTVTAPALKAPIISYAATQVFTTGTAITALSPVNTGGAVPNGYYGRLATIAGSSTRGYVNATGTAASFSSPAGIAFDKAGNAYVADGGNNVIRMITPAGVVSTFAGSGTKGILNATGTAASFNNPQGIAIDAAGNLYVSDNGNFVIRKITAAGVVSTFSGSGTGGYVNGASNTARFDYLQQLSIDGAGNLYVADTFVGQGIRKITPSGFVTGPGFTSTAPNNPYSPFGVATDDAGTLYMSDFSNRVLKVVQGVLTPLAGSGTVGSADGTGTGATFSNPNYIAVDAAGNVYVADTDNGLVRKVTAAGVVTTLITKVPNSNPFGLGLDPSGNVYYTDASQVKKITVTGYSVSPALPAGLSIDSTGVIRGTPTAASPAANYTVTAYNAAGTSTAIISIAVNNPLSFAAIPSKVYGTPDFSPGAVSTSAITYTSSNAAVATIVAGNIHIVGAGTSTITATSGTTSLTQPLTVTPADLYIDVDDVSRTYGSSNPALTVAYTGFVNGDNAASLTTQPKLATVAVAASPVGGYAINVSGAASPNYTVIYTDGLLTVKPATLKVTAVNVSRSYGAANPVFTVTYSGFKNSEGASVLNTQPTLRTTATASSPVGTYAITVKGASANNYTMSFTSGTLTITPAQLTIAAVNLSKVYGSANPSLSATYTGFVNGDSGASFTTAPVITTTATTASGAGAYPITASGAVAANYSIAYTAGTLTVTPAELYVDVNDASRAYGAANPTLSLVYSGFVNGDAAASLTTQPKLTTTALATSPVGSYAITASGAVSANYTFIYFDGLLNVTPAALKITAVSVSRVYGAANPVLTATYSGFKNNESASSLSVQPVIRTTAVVSSPAGTYPITVKGASSNNYTISYVSGTLTVTAQAGTNVAVTAAANVARTDEMLVKKTNAAPEVNPALSPNGDGINDILHIENVESYPDNRVMLMDKNGKSIYEVQGYNNYSKAFDGHSNKTGAMQPAGTYFYLLEYRENGELKRKTGYFIIKY